ncbi:MAG: sulfotransferase family protein [Bacteroidota bacterium]
MPTTRVCLWAGPRSLATPLMYAFGQRADTQVLDEPLYGHYLQTTGVAHPGRTEVLAQVEVKAEKAIYEEMLGACPSEVLFIKNMAHHLVGLNLEFLEDLENIFLIRHPREVLPSLSTHIPNPTLLDSGYKMLHDLYQYLVRQGKSPLVIDAQSLQTQPEMVLRHICGRIGLAYDPAMMQWAAGGLEKEGIWGKYWYKRLHKTTGFSYPTAAYAEFPEKLAGLLETCEPYYLRLYRQAQRVSPPPAWSLDLSLN